MAVLKPLGSTDEFHVETEFQQSERSPEQQQRAARLWDAMQRILERLKVHGLGSQDVREAAEASAKVRSAKAKAKKKAAK
jgi:hypothetical protein